MQKYAVNQYQISNILSDIEMGLIAIPEIQRPFIWTSVKVRDLMDSLYQGYPIGYIIAWKNPDVKLKDGSLSSGKKILIDGQQRITALRAAILGEKVVNKEYKEINIKIAFNPLTEKFETLTPAIEKDTNWIPNISQFLKSEDIFEVVENYCSANPQADRKVIQKSFQKLLSIKNKQVGFIELTENLDIETVTEIFIRINSKGVVLSQADFAMSKIASSGTQGILVRKIIDYFCHLTIEPKYYKYISENDADFTHSGYLEQLKWLENVNDDLYDPNYTDVIRVAFTKNFKRGKLSDLVALLSGRNFETRQYEIEIANATLENFKSGVLDFINQTNFERFVMIIKSTGFISSSLVNSQITLNVAYTLYLMLKKSDIDSGLLEKIIKKWFVMSILTSRYSGSAESVIDADVRNIEKLGIEKYLENIESSDLSPAFWENTLTQELNKSSISNPFINLFFAAQSYFNDEGFLSTDIKVKNMIEHRGDIHHIFPKDYLRKQYPSMSEYNQIANFVYAQQEINIKIGNKSPKQYFNELLDQISSGKLKYGNITDKDRLLENIEKQCIPESIMEMELAGYPNFLESRRKLMAKKIEKYYKSL